MPLNTTIGLGSGRPNLNANTNSWTLFPIYCMQESMLRGVVPGMLDPWEDTRTFALPNHTIMKNESTEVMAIQIGSSISNVFFSLDPWTLPVGSVTMSIGGTS